MTVRLGVTVPQFTDDPDRFLDGVRAVEGGGLDSVWFFDHLWPLSGGKDRPILECWTALAHVAAATREIGIGTLVTRSTMRHPAVLAKSVATVAAIAPGRLTIAIGSGDELSRDENESFGLSYFESEDRIEQLRSTVTAVRSFLHGERITQRDDFTQFDDLPPSPRPTPPPPVWVGGRSDGTLEIAATCADGWNGWSGSPERFAQDAGTVLEMCEGRPVEVTWGGLVVIREDDGEAESVARDRGQVDVWGGPEKVAAELRSYVEAGATHLIVVPAGRWNEASIRLLAEEVRPRLIG